MSSLISRRQFIIRPLLLALSSASIPHVRAHAKLVRTEPRDSATLHESPKTIDLWFNEILDKEFNSIAVFASKDSNQDQRRDLATKKPSVDPKDGTRLTVKLPPLPPGAYTVEFRVLSRDGHTSSGHFHFTVAP